MKGAPPKANCLAPDHRTGFDCLEALEEVSVPTNASPETIHIEVPCLVARLKHGIIRLRRGAQRDWCWFRSDIESNLDFICSRLNTRWLVSIADTYADYGTQVERGNAALISLLANWEKLALTQRLTTNVHEPYPSLRADDVLRHPHPLWDGMTSMLSTEGANVLPNLVGRLSRVLSPTPHLWAIFRTIVERMEENPASTVSSLNRVHQRDLWADIHMSMSAPDLPKSVGQDSAVYAPPCDLYQTIEDRFTQLETSLAQEHWRADQRYRDLIQLLTHGSNFCLEPRFNLQTGHPVAAESLDHCFPHGTARDNTRAPWFVQRCEALLGSPLKVLDLGCAGGGLVLDFALRGHRAVGLEGSDFSLKRARAEWRTLKECLFTCDITEPFTLTDQMTGSRASFDLITAWDVLEHLTEREVVGTLENVLNHLSLNGYFLGSVSTRASATARNGQMYHRSVKPRDWWESLIRASGFDLTGETEFDPTDFPRGNGVSILHPANFSESPESGFFVIARRADRDRENPT